MWTRSFTLIVQWNDDGFFFLVEVLYHLLQNKKWFSNCHFYQSVYRTIACCLFFELWRLVLFQVFLFPIFHLSLCVTSFISSLLPAIILFSPSFPKQNNSKNHKHHIPASQNSLDSCFNVEIVNILNNCWCFASQLYSTLLAMRPHVHTQLRTNQWIRKFHTVNIFREFKHVLWTALRNHAVCTLCKRQTIVHIWDDELMFV